MKRGRFLRWGGRLAGDASIRQPQHRARTAEATPLTEARLLSEARTLQQIIAGLDQLQQRAEHTGIIQSAGQRGYLIPEEDDRVRQGLLAYRNYRLALYEIILQLEQYPKLKPAGLRLKAFLVAYAAALTLYSKSLRLDELAAKSPLIRGKLNEPEPKFDLEEGFFDDVMSGFCSLRNYGLILRATWFWTMRRRAIRALARVEPEPWAGLEKLAVVERRTVQSALNRVLRSRLKLGWRSFWQTAFKPVDRAQYDLRARVGGRFAGAWVHPDRHQAPDDATLKALAALLQPGDVLLMRSEGKLTAALLPGFWAHAAIFLGDREALSALNPEQAKEAETDARLGFVIEGVSPCVRIVSLKTCLDTDHVLVVRPLLPPEAIGEALSEALLHLGKPYDFEFDFNLSSRIVCTGLVYRAYHGRGAIQFHLIKRLGNFTLTGDDLAAQALASGAGQSAGFAPIALLLRRKSGRQLARAPRRIHTLLHRIERGWRPIR